MRSTVQAVALFMTAIANAIGEGLIALSTDPLLVWNYGSMATISFVAGVVFWITHRKLDQEEDSLNQLPQGRVGTKAQAEVASRRGSVQDMVAAGQHDEKRDVEMVKTE